MVIINREEAGRVRTRRKKLPSFSSAFFLSFFLSFKQWALSEKNQRKVRFRCCVFEKKKKKKKKKFCGLGCCFFGLFFFFG
jgi:hypothetical protein